MCLRFVVKYEAASICLYLRIAMLMPTAHAQTGVSK